MSYNVLVIPEDFRKDQGILKPIVSAMLAAAGRPRANVRVCQNPRLGGTGQALKKERIAEVVQMYPMINLFLLCVDRDGQSGRRQQLDNIESYIRSECDRVLLAENAWQEIEVWVLAGLTDLPADWAWTDIRADANPKEVYYLPIACRKGLEMEPDEGRGILARQAAANYQRIHQLCAEDIQTLQRRVQENFSV
jgi:hypothetical protein